MNRTNRSSDIIMDELGGYHSTNYLSFCRNMNHIIMLNLKNSQNLLRS